MRRRRWWRRWRRRSIVMMMMMMMMTTMMLSPKTHRTYKVIVTRRPEMHHCSYNLRCSFQDKRVHLVTIRQRWHAVNLP